MSLIACNKCGKEYSNLAPKCPICGYETESPDVKRERSKNAKIFKYTIIGLIISAVLIVGGIQGYSYYNYTKGNSALMAGDFGLAINYYEKTIWNKSAKDKIEKCEIGASIENEIKLIDKEIAEITEYEERQRILYLHNPDSVSLFDQMSVEHGITRTAPYKNRREYLVALIEKIKDNEKVQYVKDFYMPL